MQKSCRYYITTFKSNNVSELKFEIFVDFEIFVEFEIVDFRFIFKKEHDQNMN